MPGKRSIQEDGVDDGAAAPDNKRPKPGATCHTIADLSPTCF